MAYRPSSDKILLSAVVFLTVLGLLMVFSTSFVHAADKHGDSYYFFVRQLKFAGFGLLALVGLMHLDYRRLRNPKVFWPILIATAAALIFALIQPAVNGAHRWISIKGFSIQPSEFAKPAVLIFIAWFLHNRGKTLNDPKRSAALWAVVATIAGLILAGPDLGQAFTLCLIVAVLLVMAGLSWRYIAGAFLAAIPVFYLFVYRVPYRWSRVNVFLNPENSPDEAVWQIRQSLIAVGSGGFFGLGPGDSKQKLFFLPESSTDFIFAIICEEWGFIGAILVIAAFLIFFYRGMKIAANSQDKFGFYLGTGITLMVTLQGLINITMVLGMMPTKGIALPFISQGGSSLLMNLAATGILLNLAYQNKHLEPVE